MPLDRMTNPSTLPPRRLFGPPGDPTDPANHQPFLERARREREQGRDVEAQLALAAYLVARLATRALERPRAEEQLEGFRWQLGSTRRQLDELPAELPEVAHLVGIADASADGPDREAVLRLSLMAYAYFLEHEGRFEEALDVLGLAAHSFGAGIPLRDFVTFALSAARLQRLLARWERAMASYREAEEVAGWLEDRATTLRARLGQSIVHRGQGNLPAALAGVERVLAEAQAAGLDELVSDAYLDLGATLDFMGRGPEALRAQYLAFRSAQDPLQRMRVLGDLGGVLAQLGELRLARSALEVVAQSPSSVQIQLNALIELMDVSAQEGDRLGFQRHRTLLGEHAERMAPRMLVDWHYKSALGYVRFGHPDRARRHLETALEVAQAHALHQWVFRVEAALAASAAPEAPRPAAAGAYASVLAEVSEGLVALQAS